MDFLSFDNVLSSFYQTGSQIDPYIYLLTHFDLLRNEVDIFALENETENHSELIQIIKDYEVECFQNYRNNFQIFDQKFYLIIDKRIELYKEPKGTQEYVEKNLQIRKEWIQARKMIFKKNLFFLNNSNDSSENFHDKDRYSYPEIESYKSKSVQNKKFGFVVLIEPFCLDDLQIDIIK